MTDFHSLGLAEPLLVALKRADYSSPTPIQAQAIPLVLVGRDLFGIAQTGTGKTAAFALPILHRLVEARRAAPRKGCRALVLAPTRELAAQIAQSFATYGRGLDLAVATICGGASPRPQRQMLARGIDILVATPGRLLDHMSAGAADMARTEILVLDEADQMLDLGFLPSLRRIVAALPEERQTLLFSATMPAAINRLATTLLREPARVSVAPAGTTAERVRQRVIHVAGGQKREVLAALCSTGEPVLSLVFTRTKRGADRVAKHLEACGVRVAAIHGNKSQGQRERALEAFRGARIDVLVATDIAARGIDVNGVAHVINYDLPDVPEAYVHRIGRTARAGASGRATSLCEASERRQLREIERLTGHAIPAEVYEAGATPADRAPTERQTLDAVATERRAPAARNSARDRRPAPPARAEDAARDTGRRPRDGKAATKRKTEARRQDAKTAAQAAGNGHWWERTRAPSAGRGRRRAGRSTASRAMA